MAKQLLTMFVNPAFEGQKFSPQCPLQKVIQGPSVLDGPLVLKEFPHILTGPPNPKLALQPSADHGQVGFLGAVVVDWHLCHATHDRGYIMAAPKIVVVVESVNLLNKVGRSSSQKYSRGRLADLSRIDVRD